MSEKKLTLKATGISPKQWGVLILELNLMKKAWKPYGVKLDLQAPGVKAIIEKGTRRYDFKGIDK